MERMLEHVAYDAKCRMRKYCERKRGYKYMQYKCQRRRTNGSEDDRGTKKAVISSMSNGRGKGFRVGAEASQGRLPKIRYMHGVIIEGILVFQWRERSDGINIHDSGEGERVSLYLAATAAEEV